MKDIKPIVFTVTMPKEFEPILGKGNLEGRVEMPVNPSFVDLVQRCIDELTQNGTRKEAAQVIMQEMINAIAYKSLKENVAQGATRGANNAHS